MFKQAVMGAVGVKNIPTFESFDEPVKTWKKGELGHACQGKKIEQCRVLSDKYTAKDLVISSDEKLQMAFCAVCTEGAKR